MIDDTLALYVTEPSGRIVRIGPDEPGLPLTDYTLSTTLPGGFSTADGIGVLPRHPVAIPSKLAPVTIRSQDGTVAWEGRVESTPERSDEGTLSLSLIGHQAALTDDPSVVFLGVLSDTAAWEDPSAAYVEDQSNTGNVVNARLTSSASEGGITITMNTDVDVATKHRGVAWISMPAGVDIGHVQYLASVLSGTSMTLNLNLSANENGTSSETHSITTGLVLTEWTPTTAARYLRIVASPSVLVNKATQFVLRVHRIALYGDHGLPRHEIATDLPDGLLYSDVIEHLIGLHAPFLSVEASPSTIASANIHYLEPTDLATVLDEAVSFEADREWGVFENMTFHYKRREEFGREWVVRRSEGARFVDTGETAEPDYNAVVVTFTDDDGTPRRVGPPGSGADTEDPSLEDTSSSNPVNASPVVSRRTKVVDAGQMRAAKAIEVGQLALSEVLRRRFAGEVELPRYGECEGQRLPTWMMRSGDWVVDGDASNPERMPLVETSYSRSSERPMRAVIDTPANRLDAALAGHGVRPAPFKRRRVERSLRKRRKRNAEIRRRARRQSIAETEMTGGVFERSGTSRRYSGG